MFMKSFTVSWNQTEKAQIYKIAENILYSDKETNRYNKTMLQPAFFPQLNSTKIPIPCDEA